MSYCTSVFDPTISPKINVHSKRGVKYSNRVITGGNLIDLKNCTKCLQVTSNTIGRWQSVCNRNVGIFRESSGLSHLIVRHSTHLPSTPIPSFSSIRQGWEDIVGVARWRFVALTVPAWRGGIRVLNHPQNSAFDSFQILQCMSGYVCRCGQTYAQNA